MYLRSTFGSRSAERKHIECSKDPSVVKSCSRRTRDMGGKGPRFLEKTTTLIKVSHCAFEFLCVTKSKEERRAGLFIYSRRRHGCHFQALEKAQKGILVWHHAFWRGKNSSKTYVHGMRTFLLQNSPGLRSMNCTRRSFWSKWKHSRHGATGSDPLEGCHTSSDGISPSEIRYFLKCSERSRQRT